MSKLSKKDVDIRIVTDDDNNETVKIKVTVLPEDVLEKIPRPGESIYLIKPYPVVDPEDVDGEEIHEEDIKLKPIMGYSYAPVMVKGSVLNDEMDEVMVNGDYKISLYKDGGDTNKKLIVLKNEEEAVRKFKTLMTASINEAERRETLNTNIKNNLRESLTEMFH